MLNLALLGNGESVQHGQRSDAIQRALNQLNPQTKQFVELCIDHDHEKRPQAHTLLKHFVLQEVRKREREREREGERERERERLEGEERERE